jgi:hypothetical protein
MDGKGVLCGRVGVAGIRCWVNKVLVVGTQVGCGTVKISNSDPGGTVCYVVRIVWRRRGVVCHRDVVGVM